MNIIAYDISDPERLRLVAAICEKYLIRVQKSVFEGELTKSQLYSIQKELKKVIEKKDDSVIIYLVRKSAMKRKIILGKKPEDDYIII